MLGNWIAWNKGLTLKREVLSISRQLGLDRRVVASLCMEVWEWAGDQTTNGFVAAATMEDVDAVVAVKGFASAMAAAGWLAPSDNGLMFPNWERWNASSAKRRLKETERKRTSREVT